MNFPSNMMISQARMPAPSETGDVLEQVTFAMNMMHFVLKLMDVVLKMIMMEQVRLCYKIHHF